MTNGPNAANAARKRSRKRREFSAGGEKKLRGELPAVSCVSFAVDVAARASTEVVDSFFSCVDAGCKDVKAASVVFSFCCRLRRKSGARRGNAPSGVRRRKSFPADETSLRTGIRVNLKRAARIRANWVRIDC